MCAIGVISVGRLLIAIIMPGLLMAAFYAVYIVIRARLQPSLAPPYETPPIPLSQKLISTARYILPTTFVIFMVIGVMMLGVVTPTEAAATGALASFILVAFYGRLTWETAKKSFVATFKVTVMLFMIICGASTFAQNLAYTGATRGFIELAVGLNVAPIVVIIIMQIIVLILGCFLDTVGIMMITLPIYVPIVQVLGYDLVWFGAILLLNLEMAIVTPPYGTALFTLKGVAPHVPMGEIYKSGFPFLGMNAIVMALMIVFPPISLWLPGLMR
jgi:tripartite ATP-independent transporter DctM subunit